MIQYRDQYYYGARAILLLYILSVLASYIYACCIGEYNGDFIGESVYLSKWMLFLLFCSSLIPFIYIWTRYKKYKQRIKYITSVNTNKIGKFALVFLAFSIILRIFNIGVMSEGAIQNWVGTLSNNIFTFYFFIGAFIIHAKNKINVFIISLLCLFACILKTSLSELLYLLMFLILRYYSIIKKTTKRYWLIVLVLFLFLPRMIAVLYDIRSNLRTGESDSILEQSSSEIIYGRLAGRFSSFSDTAYIVENAPIFYAYAHGIPLLFYQYQWLDRFGIHLGMWSDERPERFLYEQNKHAKEDAGTSFMLGIPGILIISFMRSPIAFLINILTILILIDIYFSLISKLPYSCMLEQGFVMLIYPVMSGVSLELFFTVIQCCIFVVCLRLFANKKYLI